MISSPAASTAGGHQQSRPLAVECRRTTFYMEDAAGGYVSGRMGGLPHDKTSSYRKRNTNRSGVKMLGFGSLYTREM